MIKLFTTHPHSIGETYFEHLIFASLFGFNLLIGGIACLIHAIFPFLFVKTGSNFLLKMTNNFVDRMTVVEDRVAILGEKIEKKRQQNS